MTGIKKKKKKKHDREPEKNKPGEDKEETGQIYDVLHFDSVD